MKRIANTNKKIHSSIPYNYIIKKIQQDLSGSGFDYEWNANILKNGKLEMESYFHVMNENGCYVGGYPIKIVFFLHKKPIYNKLKGPSRGFYQELHYIGKLDYKLYFDESRLNCLYGLKDYISDCVYNSLEHIL